MSDSLTLPRRAYTVVISRRSIEGVGEGLRTRTTSSQTGNGVAVAVGHPQRIHLVKSSAGDTTTLDGWTIVALVVASVSVCPSR